MERESVSSTENNVESRPKQPPVPSPSPDSDSIRNAQSAEPIDSSSRQAPDPDTRSPFQDPSSSEFESNTGSSADEITPADRPTNAPATKYRGGQKKSGFHERYDPSEYNIEQLSEYDDVDLVKPWHRWLIMIHPIVIAWVFITYAAYYGYRVWCNYQYRRLYGGLNEASWIFIVVEGVILCKYIHSWAFASSLHFQSSVHGMDDRSFIINRRPQTKKTTP